ncbi:hypothetical protein KR009_005161, partial [Drosophila setifemur]
LADCGELTSDLWRDVSDLDDQYCSVPTIKKDSCQSRNTKEDTITNNPHVVIKTEVVELTFGQTIMKYVKILWMVASWFFK